MFRKPSGDEFDKEIRFHIEWLAKEKMAEGMPTEQAWREARLAFGGSEAVKEDLRDVHRIPFVDAMATLAKQAWRALRHRPAFALTVIATLTLGIGANTAVFSAIDAVILRALPYPNPDRLLILQQYSTKGSRTDRPVAPVRIEDWNRMSTAFQSITGYYTEDASDTLTPLPTKISTALVAPRFLRTLGVSPMLGHDFPAEDEHFHGHNFNHVLISYTYWRTRLNSDPNIVGKTLKDEGTVIGVMPASFAFPSGDVMLWYSVPVDGPYVTDRRNTWFTGIGRTKPSVSREQAAADLMRVQQVLGREYPLTDSELKPALTPLRATVIGTTGHSLWLLYGSVTLLLLIACTNVAALLLARGVERRHEFSIRLSIGASRASIMKQVLAESLMLAAAGAIAGLGLALACDKWLASLAKAVPRIENVHINGGLLLYTAGVAVLVTLVAGIFPALQASAAAPAEALGAGGRNAAGARLRGQWALVCVQIALAVCLLAGASVLLRSFQALAEVSPGFDAEHVIAFRMTGNYGETINMPKLRAGIRSTVESLRNLPGSKAAAASLALPGVPMDYPASWSSPDYGNPDRKVIAQARWVSSGYFASLRIPILAGAGCSSQDEDTIVVNQSFAAANFGSNNALGHHLHADGTPVARIVGVAADAREAGLNQEPGPVVYSCADPIDPGRWYLVRSRLNTDTLIPLIRQRMHQIEPGRAVYDIAPLSEHLANAFGEIRLRTLLLTLFAVTAVTLACVGLYGTLNYFVSARKREIGVRMAIGAQRRSIYFHILYRAVPVLCIGITAGLGLALACGRFLRSLLYHVRPADATGLGFTVVAMLCVGIIASALPCIRAARMDPVGVLREE